jgi:hypothetical protein
VNAEQLHDLVFAHLADHPSVSLSAYEWARVLGLGREAASWAAKYLRQWEAGGELAAAVEPRFPGDLRPVTRWGLPGKKPAQAQ